MNTALGIINLCSWIPDQIRDDEKNQAFRCRLLRLRGCGAGVFRQAAKLPHQLGVGIEIGKHEHLADFGVLIAAAARGRKRSEEHTSELQSLMRISYAVFCLKKKNKTM